LIGHSILVFETNSDWRESAAQLLRDNAVRVMNGFEVKDLKPPELSNAGLVILAPSRTDSTCALEAAKLIRKRDRHVSVLFVTSISSEDLAIDALRAGVTEYLKYPFSPDELAAIIRRCCRPTQEMGDDMTGKLADSGLIVGESVPIRQVKSYIAKIASTNSNVLITGETGTGKELAAELVHRCSSRREKPFFTINSAAIPDSLFESELFGYDRGAFTGAESRNEGKLVAANGGSIFLDEIADLSTYAQAKILRVIENKEIYRLGGKRGISINVRFIAATNQNLEELVAEGKYRKDLFFRLNVARVHLPPLRERKEDLPLLLDYFIQALSRCFGLRVRRITDEALDHLLAYDWPGNIRELKNLVEAIFVNLSSSEISLDALPLQFRIRCERSTSAPNEQDDLLRALVSTKWNKSKAAEKLRWSRMTLYRKMARYKIASNKGPGSPTDGGASRSLGGRDEFHTEHVSTVAN
jgi:DNA-binding NtrC family response regulator